VTLVTLIRDFKDEETLQHVHSKQLIVIVITTG
jgi:hypothetical protein